MISRWCAPAALVVVGLLYARESAAQQPKPAGPAGRDRSNSQFNLHREEAGGPDAATGRARARQGDCAGALQAFDQALRTSIDPTVRRDRGLCHEKLGNPYPAMDDYRAYITARPEAADAEQIRARLAALEGQTAQQSGGEGKSSSGAYASEDARAEANLSMSSQGASGSASVSAGSKSSSSSSLARRKNLIGPRPGEKEESYDYYLEQEKLADAADTSPLRYGSGLVLGPVVHIPRFFLGDGASSDVAFGVALGLRYSTGPTLTLLSELGYAGIGDQGAVTSQSGPLLMAGLEARIPISRWASDHLLLRGGAGYERYVVQGTRAVNHTVLGRFAFGYRHVFGPAVGLEILADGGPAYIITDRSDTRFNGHIGGSFAFVVGF